MTECCTQTMVSDREETRTGKRGLFIPSSPRPSAGKNSLVAMSCVWHSLSLVKSSRRSAATMSAYISEESASQGTPEGNLRICSSVIHPEDRLFHSSIFWTALPRDAVVSTKLRQSTGWVCVTARHSWQTCAMIAGLLTV